MHQAVAGKTGNVEQPFDRRFIANDGPMIRRGLIESGPLIGDFGGLQLRYPIQRLFENRIGVVRIDGYVK